MPEPSRTLKILYVVSIILFLDLCNSSFYKLQNLVCHADRHISYIYSSSIYHDVKFHENLCPISMYLCLLSSQVVCKFIFVLESQIKPWYLFKLTGSPSNFITVRDLVEPDDCAGLPLKGSITKEPFTVSSHLIFFITPLRIDVVLWLHLIIHRII